MIYLLLLILSFTLTYYIKNYYKNIEFQLLGFLDVDNNSAISQEQMNIWVEEGCVNYIGVV